MNDQLWRLIASDLHRYRGETTRGALRDAWLREAGFRFSYHLRQVAFLAQHRRGLGLPAYLLHRALLHRYRFRYGFDISPQTAIGPGLYLGHFGGTVLSPSAVLGSNVNIGQGATLGATSRGKHKGAPTLEDRVWIGAHAIVVGRITIGHDALVAPGAYVNFDVPPHAVVLGNPGQIISQTGSEGYISNAWPTP